MNPLANVRRSKNELTRLRLDEGDVPSGIVLIGQQDGFPPRRQRFPILLRDGRMTTSPSTSAPTEPIGRLEERKRVKVCTPVMRLSAIALAAKGMTNTGSANMADPL